MTHWRGDSPRFRFRSPAELGSVRPPKTRQSAVNPFRFLLFLATAALAVAADTTPAGASAASPAKGPARAALKWHPGHYILVGSGEIRDDLIALPRFRGFQKMYGWKTLEPARDRYDFSAIRRDLERLAPHGKQLVVQLQYKAFGKDARLAPDYLEGEEFGGGVYRANSGSWNPVIWNDHVGERMAALFRALGAEFDRHLGLELVVLPETAPSASLEKAPQRGVQAFTLPAYVNALKEHMLALRHAFPNTAVIQYTNFPPGALPELIAYMKEIGVGMGGPDVYPRPSELLDPKRGAYRFYASLAGTVPLGAAVQSPDYSVASWKRTMAFNRGLDRNSVQVTAEEEQPIPVREHLQLARETLHLNYLFWSVNPKHHFANVVALLDEPDLADDPAGGLDARLPRLLSRD